MGGWFLQFHQQSYWSNLPWFIVNVIQIVMPCQISLIAQSSLLTVKNKRVSTENVETKQTHGCNFHMKKSELP